MPMNIVCWGYNQWKSCCLWINFSWCLISQANSWRQPNKEIRWIIQDEDFYTVFSGVMCADNHSFWGYLHAQPKVCTLQWVEWNFLTFLLSQYDNRKKSLLAWPSDWNSRFLFKIFTMRMLILFSVLLLYHNSLSSCIIPHKKAFAPTTYMYFCKTGSPIHSCCYAR